MRNADFACTAAFAAAIAQAGGGVAVAAVAVTWEIGLGERWNPLGSDLGSGGRRRQARGLLQVEPEPDSGSGEVLCQLPGILSRSNGARQICTHRSERSRIARTKRR